MSAEVVAMSTGPKHVPNWVPVRFETAVVAKGASPDSYTLTVKGETLSGGETSLGVRLIAPKKYLVQPEYWEIAVEWDRAGAILQSIQPYTVSIPLDGIRGTSGIELVGREQSKRIDVP